MSAGISRQQSGADGSKSGMKQVSIDRTLDRSLQTDLGDLVKEAELCLQELQLIFGHSLPDLQAQHVCMAHFAAT